MMEFRILGPLEVVDDGQVLELGATKQQTLLGVLLLHPGEIVSPTRLMGELWGEVPPASAAKAIQGYVSGLRRILGAETIVTRTRGYVLTPEWLDADEFERLAAVERFREALALWRGEPLQGIEFEGLARHEADTLGEQRLAVLERRVEADLAVGRDAELVAELQELVAAHPLRERLRGHLMLALYRSGRQADGLALYRDTRAFLADELGLQPGEALRRLERLMLEQSPELDAPAAPAPTAAPAPRAAEPEPSRRRRLVSVVVAEVTGAAALAERLDAESLHALLDRGSAVCAEVIERHGGTVESFQGDSAIGVFGQERLHEDDALRAVRAAAELCERVAALGAELEQQTGGRVALRAGVDSGEMYVAAGARRQAFATGDVLHVATGLKALAADGEVVLGDRTRRLAGAGLRAEPLGVVELEGRAAAVEAWRLVGLGTPAPLEARPPDTPFVGRVAELAELAGALARAEGERAARLVTVTGPAGIGKSRLAREAVAGASGAATVVTGTCVSYGEGVAYRPLAEIVDQLGDLGAFVGDEEVERRILAAIGRSGEATQPEETAWAVRRLFEAVARERPLVVVVDDAHWAEPALLDLFDYVIAFSSGSPILLVCLGRPEVLERRPAWATPQRSASVVALDALADAEALALIETLGAEPNAARRIVARAEGNPLFLEQLVAIGGDAFPPTIEAVLAARLEGLGAEERALLEHASIEGRSFHRGAVAALLGADALGPPLIELARAQLIQPDVPTHAGEDAFRFGHALIRDVAYRGLPKRRRAELHERLAGWLAAQPEPEDEIVGYHLEQACRYRGELGLGIDGAVAAEAAQRLASAARDALRRGDAAAGAALFERAAALLPRDGELLRALGAALLDAGRLDDAERELTAAIERARAAADPQAEARAHVERELVRLHLAPGSGTEPARRAADAALDTLSDDLGLCRAWRLRAWIAWTESQSAAAQAGWREAAERARRAGDDRERLEILCWSASAAAFGPTPIAEAVAACERIAVEVGHSRVATATTLRPLALLRAMTGDFAEARRLVAEANAILDELGQLHSRISHQEAQVEMLAGDAVAASARLHADMDRLEGLGEQALLATTAAMLAQALHAQGRLAEAESMSVLAERSAAPEDLSTQAIWRGVRAQVLARGGRHEEAEALVREAIALVERSDALTDQGDALLVLAEILDLRGRPAEAAAAARDALARYSRKGATVMADRARSAVERSERRVDGGDHAEIAVR